jgi:hypothetical protein
MIAWLIWYAQMKDRPRDHDLARIGTDAPRWRLRQTSYQQGGRQAAIELSTGPGNADPRLRLAGTLAS